jgi:hypothetical protein
MNRALFFVISLEGQILRAVLAAGCAVLMAALSGCGGGYGLTNNNPPDNNPVPSVTSLSPTSAVTGAGAQTLTIDGSGFISSSSVSFNGTAHTASFVSSSVLTISLSASDQANAGTFAVTVTNPSPGGGSSSKNFAVNYPAPTVSSLLPATATIGAAGQNLTINGSGFDAHTTVSFNGLAKTPTVVSASQMTIGLTASDQAVAGAYSVAVANPTPGGGSASRSFVVNGLVIAGTATKGSLSGATVTAYAVNADGSNSAALGNAANTDASGNFSVAINSLPSGTVRLVAAGGSYTSESDGSLVTSTSNISALVDNAATGASGVSITALSEFVNSLTLSKLAISGSLTAAHTAAQAELAAFYGLSQGAVIEAVLPKYTKGDITANPDNFTVGLELSALAMQGKDLLPGSPDDLIGALSSDISDGVFDGAVQGVPIPLAMMIHQRRAARHNSQLAPSSSLPATTGTVDFDSSVLRCGASCTVFSGSGITSSDLATVDAKIGAGIASCSCTPAIAGLNQSSSGSISSVAFDGNQYLLVAARDRGVVVIDITDPAAPAPSAKVWPSIMSDLDNQPVGGIIPFVNVTIAGAPPGDPLALVFAYNSKKVEVLDVATLATGTPGVDDPVVYRAADMTINNPAVVFSGGSAYLSGGIPFPGVGIWLATVDGYELLTSTSLTTPPQAAMTAGIDAGQMLTENAGGDATHGNLLAGNYNGLQFVLTQIDPVTLQANPMSFDMSATDFDVYFNLPFFPQIDANSIDTQHQVGLLTFEDTNTVVLVNLATLQTTAGTGGMPGTVAFPSGGALLATIGPPAQGSVVTTISGSAVDASTGIGQLMAGFSTDVVAVEIQDPATVIGGASWQGFSDWATFDLVTDFPSYESGGDPHADAVVSNITTNTPFGYVLDGRTSPAGVVQTDLKGMLGLSRVGTSGDAAHQLKDDPLAKGVVKEITF